MCKKAHFNELAPQCEMSRNNRKALAITALQRSEIFSDLSRETIEKLASTVRLEEFETSTLLVAAGEPHDYLRYVVSGHVIVRVISPAGDIVEAPATGSGQWISWGPVFGEIVAGRDEWSSANATFLAFPSVDMRRMARDNPIVYPRIINEISKRYGAALNYIWQSGFGSDEKTMAQMLLMNCALSDSQSNIAVRLTHEEIGKFSGFCRGKVGRILKRLEADNLIELGYGKVTVLDRGKLKAFAS